MLRWYGEEFYPRNVKPALILIVYKFTSTFINIHIKYIEVMHTSLANRDANLSLTYNLNQGHIQNLERGLALLSKKNEAAIVAVNLHCLMNIL